MEFCTDGGGWGEVLHEFLRGIYTEICTEFCTRFPQIVYI